MLSLKGKGRERKEKERRVEIQEQEKRDGPLKIAVRCVEVAVMRCVSKEKNTLEFISVEDSRGV